MSPASASVPSRGFTVALVSCVKAKAAVAAPARELYTSPLFRKMRAYAERCGDRWYVLSAKYGLVMPDRVIAPYEVTLHGMPKPARVAWAERVSAELLTELPPASTVVCLAGRWYRERLLPLLVAAGHSVTVPLAGLPFGAQLQWLTRRATG